MLLGIVLLANCIVMMFNFSLKINGCQSCSYQIVAYAVNNEGFFMGPTQGLYILQLCMGPSYF